VEPVWTEILFGCMHVFPDSKLDAGIGVWFLHEPSSSYRLNVVVRIPPPN
jgi:hypothetical protein